jgi:hypothetical protein
MKNLKSLFENLIISLGLYFFLTLPHITKLIFNIGVFYPLWLIIILGVGSTIVGNIITYKFFKK